MTIDHKLQAEILANLAQWRLTAAADDCPDLHMAITTAERIVSDGNVDDCPAAINRLHEALELAGYMQPYEEVANMSAECLTSLEAWLNLSLKIQRFAGIEPA